MACPQQELFRLQAVDGASAESAIDGDWQSLVILNPLAAPISFNIGGGALHCPGQALMTFPIYGSPKISAVVNYPGAVPAADAGLQAVLLVSAANLGATVGPLA